MVETLAIQFTGGRLAEPAWIHAAWAGVAAAALLAWSIASRRKAMRRFADAAVLPALLRGVSGPRRALKAALVAASLLVLGIALARPQANPRPREVNRLGRDVVFLVDVSRSMLATDLAPNRLERAKLWIGDLVDELGGDRVGLVAFAGAASVRCPLTLDRGFFRLALDELGPGVAPRGGTLIGDAIRKTLEQVFAVDPDDNDADPTRYRDIVLITDGDDQESFPVRAAELAANAGVRVIALGIGSEGEGATVLDAEGNPVRYEGRVVRSSLDTGTLRAIAAASPGNVFINVGTGEIDLAEVYRDLITSAEQTAFGSAEVLEYDERFLWFLVPAAVLLLLDSLIGDRGRPTDRKEVLA